MSEVIKFPLEKVQRTSSTKLSNGNTAKILIFEGIRYLKQEAAGKAIPDNHVKPLSGKK